MAEHQDVERVAQAIIEDISREFPGVSLRLDFETSREEHEDAYLWITPGTDDREEINDIWGFVIQLVQGRVSRARHLSGGANARRRHYSA